jgi:hypothetical protein
LENARVCRKLIKGAPYLWVKYKSISSNLTPSRASKFEFKLKMVEIEVTKEWIKASFSITKKGASEGDFFSNFPTVSAYFFRKREML